MVTNETPRLLTPDEVAERLRQSRASVYRKIAAGEIPAFRLNANRGPLRVREDELDAWLNAEETHRCHDP